MNKVAIDKVLPKHEYRSGSLTVTGASSIQDEHAVYDADLE
jgi:hypothetical protein